mmetsp:Transcript_265/g.1031  ORF Transcript_265/g.1031 Transcript_265/m.1031 type:complete len:380 (-) Transcript_265:1499-2638(-)
MRRSFVRNLKLTVVRRVQPASQSPPTTRRYRNVEKSACSSLGQPASHRSPTWVIAPTPMREKLRSDGHVASQPEPTMRNSDKPLKSTCTSESASASQPSPTADRAASAGNVTLVSPGQRYIHWWPTAWSRGALRKSAVVSDEQPASQLLSTDSSELFGGHSKCVRAVQRNSQCEPTPRRLLSPLPSKCSREVHMHSQPSPTSRSRGASICTSVSRSQPQSQCDPTEARRSALITTDSSALQSESQCEPTDRTRARCAKLLHRSRSDGHDARHRSPIVSSRRNETRATRASERLHEAKSSPRAVSIGHAAMVTDASASQLEKAPAPTRASMGNPCSKLIRVREPLPASQRSPTVRRHPRAVNPCSVARRGQSANHELPTD